jgi:hypothetical protein
MMRCIKVAALVFLCALGTSAVLAHGASMIRLVGHEGPDDRRFVTRDKIRILAFQPSGPVQRGVETQFSLQIEVDLQSAKEGVARVGFNLDSPTSFRMIDSRDLHEGIQKVSFAVKAKPVDWGERGHFTVIVNMSPKVTAPESTPTAFARKAILVTR